MSELEKLRVMMAEQDVRLRREGRMLTLTCIGAFIGGMLMMLLGIKAAGWAFRNGWLP